MRASAPAALDLFRSLDPDLERESGAVGDRHLVKAWRFELGGERLILLFFTAPLGRSDPQIQAGSWELALFRRDGKKARLLDRAVLGASATFGGPEGEAGAFSPPDPDLLLIRWGLRSEGDGDDLHADLWSVRDGRLLRLLSFQDYTPGSPPFGTTVSTKLHGGAAPGGGVEVSVERSIDESDEDSSMSWGATVRGRYLVTRRGVEATQLLPISAEASSTLEQAPGGASRYQADRAFDRDRRTAWCEGARGDGEGESITVSFDAPVPIAALSILPGLAASEKLYRANARPRKIQITPKPGAPLLFELKDVPEAQRMALPAGSPVAQVEVKVLSVYPGSRYQDLCISELAFEGRWRSLPSPPSE